MPKPIQYPFRAVVSYKDEPFRAWTDRKTHVLQAYELTVGHAKIERCIADTYIANGLTPLRGVGLPYKPSDWRYAVQERVNDEWVDRILWSP